MADSTIRGHKGARNDLTSEYVRSILDYDPETGVFRWNYRPHARKAWNTRYAYRSTGTLRSDGNIIIPINNIHYLAHRLAWLTIKGEWPEHEIDHINGVRSDNRIVNLRLATSQQNMRNQGKKPNNTSGYKGVTHFKRDGTWRAQIRYGGKQRHIGYFKTPEGAYEAYCSVAKREHGEYFRY